MSFFISVCEACTSRMQCLTSGRNQRTVESPKGTGLGCSGGEKGRGGARPFENSEFFFFLLQVVFFLKALSPTPPSLLFLLIFSSYLPLTQTQIGCISSSSPLPLPLHSLLPN
jgi:hypothetical protein